MECPFCQSAWVTFAKKRGTHLCNACGLLNVTPEEQTRWYDHNLPLNTGELELVSRAVRPGVVVAKRLLATIGQAGLLPPELPERTYQVEHHPACPKPYLVRLISPKRASLDKMPPSETQDILGYGETLPTAARVALDKLAKNSTTA